MDCNSPWIAAVEVLHRPFRRVGRGFRASSMQSALLYSAALRTSLRRDKCRSLVASIVLRSTSSGSSLSAPAKARIWHSTNAARCVARLLARGGRRASEEMWWTSSWSRMSCSDRTVSGKEVSERDLRRGGRCAEDAHVVGVRRWISTANVHNLSFPCVCPGPGD